MIQVLSRILPRSTTSLALWALVLSSGLFHAPGPSHARAAELSGSLAQAGSHGGRVGVALPGGPIADLQARIDRGDVRLRYQQGTGYLLSLLQELQIPPQSQLLVFSKTSCQRDRISPKTPRAIYFNDQAYIAWIPGSPLLEVSGVVPGVGAVFHTLEQKERSTPQLVRRDQCLECHTSSKTENIAGYLVRSYATDGDGVIDITDGCSMVDHATPLADRWGGWYICGSVGGLPHRGHSLGAGNSGASPLPAATGLGRLVDLTPYPQPTSDVVPLLVLEHQARMQNLITKLHQAAARSDAHTNTTAWRALSDSVLRYLLFIDETPLRAPIEPGSNFTAAFERCGPSDRQGRSLRRFNLKTRLFEYPCSYMIYSDSFVALPRDAKLHLYHRLWTILHGQDADPAFADLSPELRQAALEILLETKADVPVYWRL